MQQGTAGNIPLAAAFSVVPIVDHGGLPDRRQAAGSVRCALSARHGLGPPAGSRPAAASLFLHLPMRVHPALRLHHRGQQLPVPAAGPDAALVRRRLGARRTSGARSACRCGSALLATRWRWCWARWRPPRCARAPLLRPRGASPCCSILPIALPGIVTGIALRSAFGAARHPVQLLDHRGRPRDLLHRRGLQQRHRPPAPHLAATLIEASMDLGADGFQTFRHVVLPQHRHRAARRRHARLRALLRRGDRHHLHRRPADHAADLDAQRAGPAARSGR